MNHLPIPAFDYHEFDLKREDMSARDLVAECIGKSQFRWLLTNLDDDSEVAG